MRYVFEDRKPFEALVDHRFESHVDQAMDDMKNLLIFPDADEGIDSYPEDMRHYDLRILREAVKRNRHRLAR